MKVDKLPNDATPVIKGIIYQFIIAVEKCFELLKDGHVLIEKDGDVSTSDAQIEVKFFQDDLSDADSNIWNTLKNWLNEKFDHAKYKSLILLTTQSIGTNSNFKYWNIKTIDEKLKIIEKIYNKTKERDEKRKVESQSYKLMKIVIDETNRTKLKLILDKFIILDKSPLDNEYYKKIKQKWCKNILSKNQNIFLNSLLGFIVNPSTIENNWEISYDEFSEQVLNLTSLYSKETIIFPKKYTSYSLSEEDKKKIQNYLFVKRIEEIEYKSAIPEAMLDYMRTFLTLLTEIKGGISHKKVREQYEEDILKYFNSQYKIASRETHLDKIIQGSKTFHDMMIGSPTPNLGNYNDTPIYFKNGTLHHLINEEERNLKWKLEKFENE